MSHKAKLRGSGQRPHPRFLAVVEEAVDDGWPAEIEERDARTTVHLSDARSIITANDSPDVPFSRSVNPYQGCEHGCIYCFARPSHAFLDLSPGIDFETQIYAKQNAATLLRQQLSRSSYRPEVLAVGANTDPYQPAERTLEITRSILQVLWQHRHPVAIITKSSGIRRDLDLLSRMAEMNLVSVMVSITTLDPTLASRMEPRAASPRARLATIRALRARGIPTGVLASPMIPALNDHELEGILEASADAGALSAGYILVRLPHELKELFSCWLDDHYPLRKRRVMSRIRETRAGKLSDSAFGQRMSGVGTFAELLARRFEVACRRLGLDADFATPTSEHFHHGQGAQLDLFPK